MPGFDDIDRQHRLPRKPEPIKLEPMRPGADCPSPHCRGRMLKLVITPDMRPGQVVPLTCDACGWTDQARGRADG